ncbi:unnamed protein product [Gongylonema pulchrum]|uniref:Uncharacterized protein n=1 Tax=Gongylonema pulchrum TaxID=637853 RepID=A0A183DPW9_9BILA|nr:unnamed protein product [Gongylonema pulchrum]
MVLGTSSALPYHLCQQYFAASLAGTLPDAPGSAALAAETRGRGEGWWMGDWAWLGGVGRKTVAVVGGGGGPDAALEAGTGDKIQEGKKGVSQEFKARTADSSKEENKPTRHCEEK